jgi:hypothetical protein
MGGLVFLKVTFLSEAEEGDLGCKLY